MTVEVVAIGVVLVMIALQFGGLIDRDARPHRYPKIVPPDGGPTLHGDDVECPACSCIDARVVELGLWEALVCCIGCGRPHMVPL